MGNQPKQILRKSLILNKKGQTSGGFIAWFFVIVVLFAITIFILVLSKAYTEIKGPLNEGLSASLPNDSSVNVSKTLDQTNSTITSFDKLLPFILIGLFAFVLISAGFIMDHPIMLFVGIIIIAVLIVLAVVYSNVYHSIASSSEFSSTDSNFPIQSKFMQYLPAIIFIMAIGIAAVIIYGRRGGTQQL